MICPSTKKECVELCISKHECKNFPYKSLNDWSLIEVGTKLTQEDIELGNETNNKFRKTQE